VKKRLRLLQLQGLYWTRHSSNTEVIKAQEKVKTKTGARTAVKRCDLRPCLQVADHCTVSRQEPLNMLADTI